MASWRRERAAEYVLTERRFTGTPEEMAEEVEELIESLTGFRMWLLAQPKRRRLSLPQRLRKHLRVVSRILGMGAVVIAAAGSAAGQTAAASASETPAAQHATTADPASALSSVKVGLTLEGYYEYNWNRPFDRVNVLRAYDTRANVFGIQQVGAVIEARPDVEAGRRFGARLDLQFGQATETTQGSAANEPRPDVYRHIWQAYGRYLFPIGRGLQLDFGKFASNLGFETNYAKDNDHFSRAYLFGFLPFYHTGLRAALPVTDTLTVMYMLTNGVQQTEDFNEFKSHHVAAIVTPVSGLTWTTSYYRGQEQPDDGLPNGPDGYFRVFDTQIAYAPTARASVGLDVNDVTNQFRQGDPSRSLRGLGVYGRYRLADPVAVAIRWERLDDEALFGGVDQVLHGVTVTSEYRFADGFLVRGEVRRDWSNQGLFTSRQPGELRRHQQTALVGVVWWFGNRTGSW